MALNLKSLALGLVATLSVSAPAFAGWTEILSVDVPAHGSFSTTNRVRTDRLKVRKSGEDCARVRVNFTAIGRDSYSGLPIYLGLNFQRYNQAGEALYQVVPRATVFDLQLQTVAGGWKSECTYTFLAETDED